MLRVGLFLSSWTSLRLHLPLLQYITAGRVNDHHLLFKFEPSGGAIKSGVCLHEAAKQTHIVAEVMIAFIQGRVQRFELLVQLVQSLRYVVTKIVYHTLIFTKFLNEQICWSLVELATLIGRPVCDG